ncbi:type II secretion system protein GspG [Pseudoalteromonas sp. McH1-42]|uniref:type II secretion system protein GspG n=1 Tax=Pseudoalteromonas sp. McH1-42 TaxID=2917752 RepID=UPI001EF63B19|nr:type II secretion system protein GspG [Pseudoalteromonas sp. McH1-42]MCG7562390.1 type II secretion system protein GspG [Pseudoalteromonas sp. McH1-42]
MKLSRTIVLLVLLLLGVGTAWPWLWQSQGCKKDFVQLNFRHIADALEMHKLKTGRYPSNEEGLEHLASAKIAGSERGYIRAVPESRWGNDYYYLNLEEKVILLWELGSDALSGGTGNSQDVCYVVKFAPGNSDFASNVKDVVAKLPKKITPQCAVIYSGFSSEYSKQGL